jgi:hypothetical protein
MTAQHASSLELLLPAAPQSLSSRARAVGGCYALLLELATETKTPIVATLGGAATNGAEQDSQERPSHAQAYTDRGG